MAYRDYSVAKGLIVDVSGHGDFSTIAAALAIAISGQTIYLSDGTYTENVTGKAGVTLSSLTDGNATIVGTITMTEEGFFSVANINLNSNGTSIISISGSNSSILFIDNCSIISSFSPAISMSNASGSATISNCNIAVGAFQMFDISAGVLFLNLCAIASASGFVVPSTISGGTVEINYCTMQTAITSSGTGAIYTYKSQWGSSGSYNQTWITAGGSGSLNRADHCSFYSGNVAAVTITATYLLAQCIVDSSSTDVITGSGTLNAGIITFTNIGTTITTSTVNKLTTYGGTIV